MAAFQLSSEPKIVQIGWAISKKKIWVREGPAKNHITGYISGTGSRRHDLFTLDMWPHFSFQKSLRFSKSVEPSPRKRCEFDGSRPKNHISCYISGTGNRRHDPLTLDLWPHFSFQTSLRLFKSVEPSPRNRGDFSGSRPKNHISDYISGTGSRRHDLVTLDLWPHYGIQMRPRLFKSVELSPRNRCEFVEGRPKNHISGYISRTGIRRYDTFTLYLWPYFS